MLLASVADPDDSFTPARAIVIYRNVIIPRSEFLHSSHPFVECFNFFNYSDAEVI